jgi:hypothetical protein
MRIRKQNGDLAALAVAGTHVVLLGWNVAEAVMRERGILGFGIRRTRHRDGEVKWMPGLKTFEAVLPDPAPGVPVSSRQHPLQTFQWADYTAAPDHQYTYDIAALAGPLSALKEVMSVSLEVTTESEEQGRHTVFFNRGAIASQEYARRFQNRTPSEVGQAAYDWLSRGLVEAMERFIAQAGDGDELLGAFFEFQNERVFKAMRAARKRGAKLRILYDGDSEKSDNEAALATSGIRKSCKPRKRSGAFAHNKFLVLKNAGRAEKVWTGSTNLTENGIFGHSNNAHVIADRQIAKSFEEYWEVLNKDQSLKPTAAAVAELNKPSMAAFSGDTAAVFSPQPDETALDWYAEIAGKATRAMFGTFAFGIDARFVKLYDQVDDVLRFALLERKGNGKKYKQQAAEVDRIRRHPNTVVAVGNFIPINRFDRWLKEIDRIKKDVNVRFVHTKYMLVDPLGEEPVIIVGSANFSRASTVTNDENMLVIRDAKNVADIYLGEFMRLHAHYAFRESLTFGKKPDPVKALKRKYLVPDVSWIDGDAPGKGYYVTGDRALRRQYFSGS